MVDKLKIASNSLIGGALPIVVFLSNQRISATLRAQSCPLAGYQPYVYAAIAMSIAALLLSVLADYLAKSQR